jgi:hypothetical protein
MLGGFEEQATVVRTSTNKRANKFFIDDSIIVNKVGLKIMIKIKLNVI